MMIDFRITQEEKNYLGDLAKKQLETSRLPIMEERKKLWYAHNERRSKTPVIVFETKYCLDDLVDLHCQSEFARHIEMGMQRHLQTYEIVNDDTVVPDFFETHWDITIDDLGFDMTEQRLDDAEGKSVGYETILHLENLKESFHTIGATQRKVDKPASLQLKSAIEEVIGGHLPVVFKNQPQLNWYNSPAKKVVYLMGTAGMMMAVYDAPKEYQKLWELLSDSVLETYDWLIENDILHLNNGNDYAGSGSYGFTSELPTEAGRSGEVTKADLWCNLNAQESVGISPAMYGEFYYPHYERLAKEFGQIYYGCCEPIDPLWEDYVSKLPNLKKVSVSPWADVEKMGEYLRGTDIIYSRKPSPNPVAVGDLFDEEAYRQHIKEGVVAARGCYSEIICRDVYALNGDREKLGRAVEIIRETVDKYWND